MFQPATGYITCSKCDASYESEIKLREHQMVSHRGGGIEEGPQTTTDEVKSEDLQA